MDEDEFFKEFDGQKKDDTTNAFDLDQWKAEKNSAYEEKVIKTLLIQLGLRNSIRQIQSRAEEVTGVRTINYDWLLDAYPTFPVRIFARSIPYVAKIKVSDLFKRFTQTVIYKNFIDGLELFNVDTTQPAAMIFIWPNLGQFALHNYFVDWSEEYETRITRTLREGSFTLEKFKTFINTIGSRWEP